MADIPSRRSTIIAERFTLGILLGSYNLHLLTNFFSNLIRHFAAFTKSTRRLPIVMLYIIYLMAFIAQRYKVIQIALVGVVFISPSKPLFLFRSTAFFTNFWFSFPSLYPVMQRSITNFVTLPVTVVFAFIVCMKPIKILGFFTQHRLTHFFTSFFGYKRLNTHISYYNTQRV